MKDRLWEVEVSNSFNVRTYLKDMMDFSGSTDNLVGDGISISFEMKSKGGYMFVVGCVFTSEIPAKKNE